MSYAEKIILADLGGTVADVTASNALKVDGSAVTQPISAVSLPLPTGAALESTLQDIKTAVEVIDNFISGSKGLVTEDNSAAILVALGNIITALAGTLAISGTVTANAGTNLNTSALALEATLQSVKTAVETIDNAISGSEMQVDVVSSALPSGASTAANQATIISHVDGIEALLGTIDADTSNISTKIDTIAGAVSGSEVQVDIVSLPNEGQQTMANSISVAVASDQSAIPVSDGGGSITVDGPLTDAQLRATAVDVNITGGSVSIGAEVEIKNDSGNPIPISDNGGSVTVDSTNLDIRDLTFADDKVDASGTVLGAGTNYVGKVRLTDGATDGEIVPLAGYNAQAVAVVDGSGNQITSFGGGTQYTEDVASAADPVGGVIIARRRDSLSAETTTDGDNVALNSTNKGELYVKHVDAIPITDNGGSVTVDNGGTFVTQENGAALTALQLIDDAIIADDASFTPATTKIMMAGFEYDDTATDSVDEGDAGAARMSANRNIYIQIRDAAGNERGVNVNASNELKVDASGNQLSISSVGSNKSPQNNFISQQQVAANAVVVGSTTTVVYAKEMNVGIWIGRRAATASTGPINIRIEGNNTYAGAAGYWVPISTYISNYAAVESEAVSGTANAGATTINVASTTNLAVGDIVYFDNGTAANSEWHRIKSLVTNTSITLEEALVNAQTGSTIYNGAEIQGITCDVLGYYHVRVVVDGSLFTQNFMIRCLGSYAN